MTIKVVYLDYGDGVPESVREEIKKNVVLAPLIGAGGLHWDSSLYLANAFGDIPRHHPELLRIIEAAIIEYPDNSISSIEEIEGSFYFITAADGKEYVWSENIIDASLPLDPEIVRMAPDDFSNPDWDVKVAAWGRRRRDWKDYVSDNVKAIWGTFTETQKALLSTQFEEIRDEAADVAARNEERD